MDYGKKEIWFDVDSENIDNIREKGFYGKDGLAIGHKARYEGMDGGFTVISKEEFNNAYGIEEEAEEEMEI